MEKITIEKFVNDSVIMLANVAGRSLDHESLAEAKRAYRDRLDDDEDKNNEDYYPEIFQYFYISRELAEALRESSNNIIIDNPEIVDATLWCRLTCGQAIHMDKEIQQAFSLLQQRYPNTFEAI